MLKDVSYFQYDISNWDQNNPLFRNDRLVPWNAKNSAESSTIQLFIESPLQSYFSYTASGPYWKDLSLIELNVNLKPEWPFVFTAPMEGCSWIIAILS
jgi:hypothetical protein